MVLPSQRCSSRIPPYDRAYRRRDLPHPRGQDRQRLDRRVAVLALNVDERGALLDVLEEAERPALAELRGVLADDLARRRGLD